MEISLCMMPSNSFKDLMRSLNNSFRYLYPDGTNGRRRMIGILFARPTLPLSKSSIVNNLDYFHHRSGKNIDFFCAGYDIHPHLSRSDTDPPIARVGSDDWIFSNNQFNELRERFETFSKWKYGGGVELILTNAKYHDDTGHAIIEFRNSILCNLDQMIALKAITSVESFFEDIFRYAEQYTNNDPTWGFSDQKGTKVVGSALKQLIFSLLPKKIGNDVRKACEFAVVDLRKTT